MHITCCNIKKLDTKFYNLEKPRCWVTVKLGEQTHTTQVGIGLDPTWEEDVEFEVALDSGCTDHVCADVDAPGYELEESPASRCGGGFIIGDRTESFIDFQQFGRTVFGISLNATISFTGAESLAELRRNFF